MTENHEHKLVDLNKRNKEFYGFWTVRYATRADKVIKKLTNEGWVLVNTTHDFAGNPRILTFKNDIMSEEQNNQNVEEKKNSLGPILGWIFGALFALSGITYLFSQPLTGVMFLILAVILLPPAYKAIIEKFSISVPKHVKTIVVVVLLVLVGLNSPSTENDESPQVANNTVSTEQNQNVQAQQNEAPKPVSEEDQIRNIVSDQLKGSNNMDQSYIRKVDVVEQVNGGWGVFVEYNADDNLTINLRKVGIESTMSEIYIALYTSNKDVRSASIAAYFPLVDRYGNESEDVIYKSILGKPEADKVNWGADSSSLKISILPKVWTTSILHPEFR